MKCVSSGSHSKVANGSQKGWLKKTFTLIGIATFFLVAVPQVKAIIPAGPPDIYSTDKAPTDLVSQLDLLKWMVNLAGDTPLFDNLSTVGDYVYWAKKFHIHEPKGGWHPNDHFSDQFFAEVLVDWFKIKAKKGQEIQTLAREGIIIPNQDQINWQGLTGVVDDAGFQSRLQVFSHLLCSPITGNKHKQDINKCTPPPTPIGEQKNRKFHKFKEKGKSHEQP
jgi:hypothetical protein